MSPEWQALKKKKRGRKPPALMKRSSRSSPARWSLAPPGLASSRRLPMPAPVDDVVAAVFLDLRLQPLAGDAVGKKVGDDAALRVDFLFEESVQQLSLQPGRQRARTPRLGEDEQHAQALVPAESERLRGRFVRVMDDADQEVPFAQGSAAARAISHGTRARAAAR